MITAIKNFIARIRTAKVRLHSLAFLYFVLAVSFLPVVLYIGVWLWVVLGRGEPPLLNLLQDMRQFVGTVFSTQVVAGVLAYGAALIDDDGDGESDDMERKVKREDIH